MFTFLMGNFLVLLISLNLWGDLPYLFCSNTLSVHWVHCYICAKGERNKLLLIDPECKEMVFYPKAFAIILAIFIAYKKCNTG